MAGGRFTVQLFRRVWNIAVRMDVLHGQHRLPVGKCFWQAVQIDQAASGLNSARVCCEHVFGFFDELLYFSAVGYALNGGYPSAGCFEMCRTQLCRQHRRSMLNHLNW